LRKYQSYPELDLIKENTAIILNFFHTVIDRKEFILISGAYAKVHGGMGIPPGASSMGEAFSNSVQYGGAIERDGVSSTNLADGHKISQVLDCLSLSCINSSPHQLWSLYFKSYSASFILF